MYQDEIVLSIKYFIIYEPNAQTKKIDWAMPAAYCASSSHKVVKSISSSERSIFIDFKKQDYIHGSVIFVATIKYNKIKSDCKSWLKNTMLISPNNPNINCSWIITRKYGSHITLDFKFIEVKPIDIAIVLQCK